MGGIAVDNAVFQSSIFQGVLEIFAIKSLHSILTNF